MRKIFFSALALATTVSSTQLRAQDKQPPTPGSLRSYAVPSVQTFTLDNGLCSSRDIHSP